MFFSPKRFLFPVSGRFHVLSSFYSRMDRDFGYRRRILDASYLNPLELMRNTKRITALKLSRFKNRRFLQSAILKGHESSNISFTRAFNARTRLKFTIVDDATKFTTRSMDAYERARGFRSRTPQRRPSWLRYYNRVKRLSFYRRFHFRVFGKNLKPQFPAKSFGLVRGIKAKIFFRKFNAATFDYTNPIFLKQALQHMRFKWSPRGKTYRQKRPRINAFNRLWQKIFLKNLIRPLVTVAPVKKNFLRSFTRPFFYKGQNVPSLKLSDSVTKGFFFQLAFFLIQAGFSPSFRFSVFLISTGFVSVNGKLVFNPFLKLEVADVVKVHIATPVLFILSHIFRKLNESTLIFPKPFTFFKRFQTPSFIGVSFILAEAVPLFIPHSFYYRSDLFTRFFHLGDLLYQRFFRKQKRFGLGRLI